jgi:putative transposase
MLVIEGEVVNKKRTYRIYCEEGLQVRTKKRKKITRPRVQMLVPDAIYQRWSMDFISDQLASGRRFRVLNVVDDFSREYMLKIVDFSISGHRVAREFDRIARRLPQTIVCDNGSEFTSKAMHFRSKRSGAKLHFIQPGKPTQKAFVESFNGKMREYCLDLYWFASIEDARSTIDD